MCTCEEALDLISARLDGALSELEAARLDDHLAACPACRDLLADLEGVHTAMPGLWAEPPADLKDRIMERVRADNVTPLPVRRSKKHWKGWAAMAAVCAVAVLGAGSLRYLGMGAAGGGASAPAAMSAGASADYAAPAGAPQSPEAAPMDAPAEAVPEARANNQDPESVLKTTAGDSVSDGSVSFSPVPSAAPEPAPSIGLSLSSPEAGALERVLQFLEEGGAYEREPLPNGALTGLLLRSGETRAALVLTEAVPLEDGRFSYTFHLHTYASEDFSPDSREAAYTVYTVDPDGAVALRPEEVPCANPGCDALLTPDN